MGRRSRDDRRTLLVTAHRRESIGTPLAGICHGIRAVVARNPDVQVVCPVHPNPTVRRTLASRLANHARIHLVEALPYETLVHLLARSDLVLTDSGGLQEEGPALGKPVLVLRDETERPEAVETGAAMVVGTDPAAIGLAVERLLRDPEAYRRMASAVSPYGDGRAAERIVCIIRKSFPQDRVSVQERRDESLKARVRPDGGQCGQVLTRVDCCPQPVQDLVPRRV
jgi:UDP-N-acetylglucosamine 2-epimerase (non-hydrolysing)